MDTLHKLILFLHDPVCKFQLLKYLKENMCTKVCGDYCNKHIFLPTGCMLHYYNITSIESILKQIENISKYFED